MEALVLPLCCRRGVQGACLSGLRRNLLPWSPLRHPLEGGLRLAVRVEPLPTSGFSRIAHALHPMGTVTGCRVGRERKGLIPASRRPTIRYFRGLDLGDVGGSGAMPPAILLLADGWCMQHLRRNRLLRP